MGCKEDDEKAYTTSEGMVGRSFRRGVRKGLAAVTGGLISGDPVGGSFASLAEDAAKELPKAISRSRKSRDED